MAFNRSIRKLVLNPNSSRTFLTSSSSLITLLFPSPLSSSYFLSHHHPFLSRSTLSKWMIIHPLRHCPLFLSYPPWKLSQSATPLFYLQSRVLFLPKLQPPLNFPKLGLLTGNHTKEELTRLALDIHFPSLVDSFLNFPNLISFTRLLSGPFLGWMIVQEMYLPAFAGLAISGATDWLDGYVARRMGINSVVGSYLDPLADKVLIGCVALAMVEKNLLHPGLVGLIVLRDVALVGGAVYKRASSLDWEWRSWFDFFNLDGTHPQKVEPLLLSKVNTVLQLILVTVALLQPEFGTLETQSYITYLSWLVASTTAASTAAYGVQHLRSKSLSIKV
ncbi:hypothetical protein LguiB_005145 [Lonicera macranthoides]